MKILAFDTSTAACSVALLMNNEIYQELTVAPQRHAELILSMIENVLSQAGIDLTHLDAIAFGQGPGSFMGVRIAVGVAQGLAFGADLPVIPVSTLRVLAQTAYQLAQSTDVIAAWDARMQAIYWGAYSLDDQGIMQSEHADALNLPQEWVIPTQKNWLFAGNAWQIYQQQLISMPERDALRILDIYPEARAMLCIARMLFREGQVHNPMEIEPLYLRNEIANLKKASLLLG